MAGGNARGAGGDIPEREWDGLRDGMEYGILPLGNMKDERLENAAEVGKLVQQERKRQKLSQLQLAGLANTGIRFVSDLENGKGTVQLQKMISVVSALGLGLYIHSPWRDA